MLLTSFDIIYVTQKIVKGQAIADQLAEIEIDNYNSLIASFLDEVVLFATSDNYDKCFKGW